MRKASALATVIPPEIKNDDLYVAIIRISHQAEIKTVLEIGSSAGGGSTEAFVHGLSRNPSKPRLFCLEVSKVRFQQLQNRYKSYAFVKCYNMSSVPASSFPSRAEVIKFYNSVQSSLNSVPLEKVLGWLDQDIDYIQAEDVPQDGIARIKQHENIDNFDMVLIDGSEFSGSAELDIVYGSKLILLDDINGLKNWANHRRLGSDPAYELMMEDRGLRNGFAIFKRVDFKFSLDMSSSLPVKMPNKFMITLDRAKRKAKRLTRFFG